MSYVIYNTQTFRLYRGNDYGPKHYETERAAKGQLTKLTKGLRPRLDGSVWFVIPFSEYEKFDRNRKVAVTNMMSGKEVLIDVNDVGGCCDPSTETYWCM